MVLEELVVAQDRVVLTLQEGEDQEMVEMEMELVVQVEVAVDLWRKQSLVFQEMTIPSLRKCPKHPSCVMAKLMVVTMLTQKLSARLSTFVPTMEMVEEQNTVSSVLMEQFSSSNTLSVTGGSMWTALLLSLCTL